MGWQKGIPRETRLLLQAALCFALSVCLLFSGLVAYAEPVGDAGAQEPSGQVEDGESGGSDDPGQSGGDAGEPVQPGGEGEGGGNGESPKPPDPNPGPDANPNPNPEPQAPALKVEQRVENRGTGEDGSYAPGDKVALRIAVENDGAQALSGVTLEMPFDGWEVISFKDAEDLDELPVVLDAQRRAFIGPLAPGARVNVHCAYTVTEQDAASAALQVVASARADGFPDPMRPEALEIALAPASSSGGQAAEDPYLIDYQVGWIDAYARFNASSTNTPIDRYIYEKDATVRLSVRVTWNSYAPAFADDPAVGMSVTYRSDDEEIATVGSDGLVTPQGKNGLVTIWASGETSTPASDGLSLTRPFTILFMDQEEQADIRVYRADGDAAGREIPRYGTGSTLTFDTRGSTFAQGIWAEIDYDGQTYSSRDGSGEFDFQIEEVEMASCEYQDTGSCYIWADSRGYDGTTNLAITIEKGGNLYRRYVPVVVATNEEEEGQGGGVVPGSLTISVSWEADPNPENPTRTEYTYTLRQLDEMSNEYHAYTIIGDPDSVRRYAYQTARGVRVVALLNDCGIYEGDVCYLAVKATDSLSVNSALMGMDFFLGQRMYYPLFWQGRKTDQGQVVPAMIAVSSRVFWNASAETVAEQVNTFAGLEGLSGSRPRLCIGAGGTTPTGGRLSVRNVETIYVTLAGAPPENVNPFVKPGGTGDGGGGGAGSADGTSGGADSDSPAIGAGAGAVAGMDMGGNAGVDGGGTPDATSLAENADASGQDADASPESAADDGDAASIEPWRVYQMMSAAKTQAAITDIENPWAPVAPWLALLAALAGASRWLAWYRYQKEPLVKAAA